MAIPTSITNRLRRVLDRGLPPALRDSPWFMYPFFLAWCKGTLVREWMDFKELAPRMSTAELRHLYGKAVSLASGRLTDTNPASLSHVLSAIDRTAATLVDIGSGRGYFLRRVSAEPTLRQLQLVGCDLMALSGVPGSPFQAVAGDHEVLPFADKSFDVVTCMHTLEHARNLPLAISELRRICRKQLIVIVPRQEYHRYTFDMHLQFFPTAEAFAAALAVPADRIIVFGDDLVYVSPDQSGDHAQREKRRE